MTETTSPSADTKSTGSKKKSQSKKSSVRKQNKKEAANINQSPTPVEPAPTPNQASSGKGLSWAAIVMSLIAMLAGGYSWYQTAVNARLESGEQVNRVDAMEKLFGTMQTTQDDFGKQLSLVKEQVGQTETGFSEQIRAVRTDMTAQEAAVKTEVASATKALGSQSDQFRAEFNTLSDSIISLKSELGRSVDSWSMEEVEQLMVIANQRLQLSGDAVLAANALKLADSRMEQLANPALTDVRSAVAKEVAALASVPSIDLAGTVNALAALVDVVSELPLAGDPADVTTDEASSAEPTEANAGTDGNELLTAGRSFLADLAGLVQVEKSDAAQVKPVLSTEMRQLTVDKTRLMLESAQVAFLREEPELYKDRMSATKNWVEKQFDTQDGATTSFVSMIDQLAEVSPVAELPDISLSLQALRGVMQSGG